MSVAIPAALRDAWRSGQFVGNRRPVQQVLVRRGFLQRLRRDDGWWTAEWTPTTGYQELPGVNECRLEQSFDANGITTATVQMANIAYRAVQGLGGEFHRTEKGWFAPYRSYRSRGPGLGVAPNEWEMTLATAAQVTVMQGYGDVVVPTFTGLLDQVGGGAQPAGLSLTARDFGQLLTDVHPFGWNIDPELRDPIHFHGEDKVRELEQSSNPDDVAAAKDMRKRWVIVKDLAQLVRTILYWAGLPDHTVRKVGTSLDEPVAFGAGEYLIDIIRKAQDVCGYTFFMGEPTDDYPIGRPIFRRSNVVTVPEPVVELRDDQLLTGLEWQRSDESLAGIIRVRGKHMPKSRGGVGVGGEKTPKLMGVYRPPWHTQERDARLIRHVIHQEPLYKTEKQCLVAAMMIGLQEALSAVTATVEIPAHPGLQLDDIIAIRDHATGVASRAWIASKQSTFTGGRNTSWKQTLGVTLLDTPDVVEVLNDLGPVLREEVTDFPGGSG